MQKSIFQSKTIQGLSLMGILTIVLAVAPGLADIFKRHYPAHAEDISSVASIIQTLGAVYGLSQTGQLVARRIGQGDVFTPKWMPGPDAEAAAKSDTVDS